MPTKGETGGCVSPALTRQTCWGRLVVCWWTVLKKKLWTKRKIWCVTASVKGVGDGRCCWTAKNRGSWGIYLSLWRLGGLDFVERSCGGGFSRVLWVMESQKHLGMQFLDRRRDCGKSQWVCFIAFVDLLLQANRPLSVVVDDCACEHSRWLDDGDPGTLLMLCTRFSFRCVSWGTWAF